MEVFLSYSQRNIQLCDEIYWMLKNRLSLTVFVDRHMPGGILWEEELQRQLASDHKPSVVLLATREAAEKPTWIQKELSMAQEHHLLIVPVEFTQGAALKIMGSSEVQCIRAQAVDENLERRLRVALLGRRIENALEILQERTRTWIDGLKRQASFWHTLHIEIARIFEEHDGLVLLGPGGAGKSTIASLLIDAYSNGLTLKGGKRSERVFSIMLDASDLRDRGKGLAHKLGAQSEHDLGRYLECCRSDHGIRTLFILDGLDQIVPDGELEYKDYARALKVLSDSARTLVTCRPEVWRESYSGLVSLPCQSISDLAEETVKSIWYRRFPCYTGHLPNILRRPLFLDFALDMEFQKVPETDVEFLRAFRNRTIRTRRAYEVGRGVSAEKILNSLAWLQIKKSCFPILRTDLESEIGSHEDSTIDDLVKRRVLRVSSGTNPCVRFVHDVLDAFNMAWKLIEIGPEQRAVFYTRMDQDGMWSVLSMLAAVASNLNSSQVLREVFEYFLYILDRKRHSTVYMNQAWGATYAIQERFETFLPLILEIFTTDEIAPPLNPGDKEGGSSISPARITQHAASSLASAFQAMSEGLQGRADEIVPRLAGKLKTWKNRFRIIEALAKFDCDSAREALLGFARKLLEERQDDEVLAKTIQELRAFDNPDVLEVLQSCINQHDLPQTLRRIAAESLHALRPGSVIVPSQSDAELIEYLRPFALDPQGHETNEYSDWLRVEATAQEILLPRIRKGEQPSADVRAALIRALQHEHIAVRAPVVSCLGYVKNPHAIDAIIEQLVASGLPANVRSACAESLRAQLANAGSSVNRQAIRVAMMRAVKRASLTGNSMGAQVLREVAFDGAWANDLPLDERGAALVPLATGARGFECILEPVDINLDPQAISFLDEADIAASGPEYESKFRISSVLLEGANKIRLGVARSTWPTSRAFHRVADENPSRIPRLYEKGLFLPPPLGNAQLPGLAVVHALVTTADDKLLLARRSGEVSYAPLHWSISFEEQMTRNDGEGPEHPVETTLRGFREEFGLVADASQVDILGAIIEIDTLNVAVVTRLRCSVTAKEVSQSWETPPRPLHFNEANQIQWLDAKIEAIENALTSGISPLHPTSQLRCILLLNALRASV
jgi:hypothetical protein